MTSSSILELRTCCPFSTHAKVGDSVLVIPIETNQESPEVATRIAILYCAQILATGLSGLIAAGVFAGMDGLKGLEGWRWYALHDISTTSTTAG
jgi:hypothetical protein